MKKNKKLLLFLGLIFSLTVIAQPSPEPPRLVVTIVIDQLRGDYLNYFNATFGEKGFKRLTHEGLYYPSIDFGFPNLGEASAVAALSTGSYPYYNGVIGDYFYDRAQGRERNILADERYMGNFTDDRLSPALLQASTLADELKIASNGQSLAYSIAPDANQAILAAGQLADGAFWVDDFNGKWATTTYYKDPPPFLERYNAVEALANFNDLQWNQAYNYYNALPHAPKKPFAHKFPKNDPQRYLKLKQTPLINAEITALADRLLQNAALGNHMATDFLALTYYAGNYLYASPFEPYTYEVQDLYHRLDKELERLFALLDRHVGLRHTLIVVASSGYQNALPQPPLAQPLLDDRKFYPSRCTALLNLYLMALYGQENWVAACYDNQIFLNRRLAEDRQIDPQTLVQKAAEFVVQLSGVQHVTTANQWLVDDAGRSSDFRRGMNKILSGDLFLELHPGWQIVDERPENSLSTPRKPLFTPLKPLSTPLVLAPLFIYGENIPQKSVSRRVKASEIAATLAYLLRIRQPNACFALPLPELFLE